MKPKDLPLPSQPEPQRILQDNIDLHDSPGYAEFYDSAVGLMTNPWEQRILREDLARISSLLPRPFKALDLGAGTGNIALKLLACPSHVVAVDPSARMLQRLAAKARRQNPEWVNRLELVTASAVDYLRGRKGQFNLITACSVLHHLPNYSEVLARSAEALAAGGMLYIAHEPVHDGYKSFLSKALETIDFKWQLLEARLGIAPDDPFWRPDCLADYWQTAGGINPIIVRQILQNKRLKVRIVLYDSKRHRLSHYLAELLGTRSLLRVLACKRV